MKNKRIFLLILITLVFTPASFGKGRSNLNVYCNSSDLTIIKINQKKLSCIYHTHRKDLEVIRAHFDSYDKHTSKISLTNEEIEILHKWALFAIETKVTEEQKKFRRGYWSKLTIEIDGNIYYPNHDNIKTLREIVFKIIGYRTKNKF